MVLPTLCPGCGALIEREKRPGRPRVHCSDRCRWRVNQRDWRKSHPLGWRLIPGPEQPSMIKLVRELGLDP